MDIFIDQISIKGKQVNVKAIKVKGNTIVIKGSFLKTATLKVEDDADIDNPSVIVDELTKNKVWADILIFRQRVPDTEPKFKGYYMEWDNFAVLRISTFQNWWDKQIRCKARNMFRKATRSGMIIKVAPYSDELMQGLMEIYNETPVRQNRPFWHYGKDFQTVKNENSTYLDQSYFIAAYYNSELIGLIKLVKYGQYASIMQIISKIKHRDKATNNGLLEKAVEICANEGIPFLVYANFIYGKKGEDKLTDFKESIGFEKMEVPRYYIPMSLKGKLVLKLNLHHGFVHILPEKVFQFLLEVRSHWNKIKLN